METNKSPTSEDQLVFELGKTRKIKVRGIESEESEIVLNEILLGIEGVKFVRVDQLSGNVSIRYDLMRVKLVDIEREIIGARYQLSENVLARGYRGLIHYMEGNERESARIEHSSKLKCGGCSLQEKCGPFP